MDIADKTLKTIEEKHITPRARWRFLAKDYFLWVSLGASVVLGALSVSALIFELVEQDWDVYSYFGRNIFTHVIFLMPYLLISLATILTVMAYYNFKYTQKGYHYEIYAVILGSISASLIFGGILYFSGLGSGIHEAFEQVPFYDNLTYNKEDVWNNPQLGLLGGEITSAKSQNDFVLRDFNGRVWEIKTASDTSCCNYSLVRAGQKVELIGQWESDGTFLVNSIRPWRHR